MSCRAALVLPAFLSACAWASPEEQVLTLFFNASGVHDQTLLADVATLEFDPRVRGTVHGFVVQSMSQEQETPRSAATSAADEAIVEASLRTTEPPAGTVRITAKDVRLRADVRTPEGRTEAQELVLTMARAETPDQSGRWIVTAIR